MRSLTHRFVSFNIPKLNNPVGYYRFLFLFLAFYFVIPAKAQHYTLIWKNRSISTLKGVVKEVPGFNEAVYDSAFDFMPRLVLNPGLTVKDVALSGQTYVALTPAEAAVYPQNPRNTSHETNFQTVWYRGQSRTVVYFNPIRFNNSTGQFEKLTTFDIAFVPGPPAVQAATRTGSTLRTSATFNSVLSNGTWFKLGVTTDGVYKLDYNYLKSIGIDPDVIDPRTFQIYGNGGGMLPQPNSTARIADLAENAIYVSGESDGKFDPQDYILFYGASPHKWSLNSSTNQYTHILHTYSNTNYYFLTYSQENGKRLGIIPDLGSGDTVLGSFQDRQYYENEITNLLHSGRTWLGELFDVTLNFSTSFNMPNLVPGSNSLVTASVANLGLFPNVTSYFYISANNSQIGTISLLGTGYNSNPVNYYADAAVPGTQTFNYNIPTASSSLGVEITFNRGIDPAATGMLNYIEVNAERQLSFVGNEMGFRNYNTLKYSTCTWQISSITPGIRIWDVSSNGNAALQQFTPGNGTASFSINGLALKEYIVFDTSTLNNQPVSFQKIVNQNLHALTTPNLLIVTNNAFIDQANTLAAFKRSNGLSVEVAVTDQIFNEFSSGVQDVTAIRDFTRYLYLNSSGSDSLQYLLLFGACSYDYKNITSGNTDFVPVYESYNSFGQLSTYCSDDYFGFMDNSEGAWTENSSGDSYMDIGVGRLPARSVDEADNLVNKIINYNKAATLGIWRTKICLVSDDDPTEFDPGGSDNNDFINTSTGSEGLANVINGIAPLYTLEKIYTGAYTLESTPAGLTAPQANLDITSAVTSGVLILNYVGHGNETQLGRKNIINIPMINAWNNANNLPFVITASCDFGRYDNPAISSGGELVLLNQGGGGIGILTAGRPVYANSNFAINSQFYQQVFKSTPSGSFPTLGRVMLFTKNNSLSGVNNRNFTMLGDPSLILNYPRQNAVISNVSVTVNDTLKLTDTIRALQKVTITGQLTDKVSNALLSNYNGFVQVIIYDKPATINTIAYSPQPSYAYTEYKSILQNGLASVQNGKFHLVFVVPKDINYQFGFGKVVMYAYDNVDLNDAGGYKSDLVIGGSSNNAVNDQIPPQVKLYMNDTTFINGGVTNTNPNLLVYLYDANGINVAGDGIGHDILAIMNNDINNAIDLNSYYRGALDNYQRGTVTYPYSSLIPGNTYTIKVRAWDTYNNPGEGNIEFIVANNAELALKNVLNYPNPFSTNTTFHMDQNRPGDDFDLMVQIYTVSGRLIKTLSTSVISSPAHLSEVHWDGLDDFGDKIGRGVYVYRVSLHSHTDGASVHEYNKLVLLGP